jgi:hypothetical protein
MDVECNSCSIVSLESKAVSSIVSRVARLTLAAFVALAALMMLCDRLSVAKRQVQAGHTVGITQSPACSAGTLCETTQYVPTRCRRPTLTVTKQIDPVAPDTGSLVAISFIITGLGLKPLDVVLVQDISGSMDEDNTPGGQTRLELAQAAAITFVNELSPTDRAAVVAYNDTAWLVQPLTSDMDIVSAAINGLMAGGYTNIGEGIHSGYAELITSTRHKSRTVKAMVLLSDGNANRPLHDPGGCARDWAGAAGECGILICTVGFGREVSHTLMQDIADLSGGEYYSSPDGSDLETIYQEIALELRNLEITDVLPPGVDLDCDLLPDAWQCITGNGFTTITIPISNSELLTDPLILSFTATVNLDPPDEYQINVEGSGICYDSPGGRTCPSFENPTATVGGRKITGVVFEDSDSNGDYDEGEGVLPGIHYRTLF